MNFTREPIIETIITPKEGHKLLVRNTKGSSAEEYTVEALEVVSFGNSFFFRSLERPKSFLVPVSDYEVSEAKETRVVLKNATFERNIKIGGGAKPKEKTAQADEQEPAAVEQRLEKKRERRRHRRRRPDSADETKEQTEEPKTSDGKSVAEGGGADDENKNSSSLIKRLIPPPKGLISDTINKTKPDAAPEAEGNVLPEPVKEEKPKRTRKKKEVEPKAKEESKSEEKKSDDEPKAKEESKAKEKPKSEEKKSDEEPKAKEEPPTESGETQRVAVEVPEVATSTSFSSIEENPSFGKIW